MATSHELGQKAKRIKDELETQLAQDERVLVLVVNRSGFGAGTNIPNPVLARALKDLLQRVEAGAEPSRVIVPGRVQ
jgi:hypothetical protein